MISSRLVVDLWRAAKLAHHHHKGLVQQAPLIQVFQQCRDPLVQRRQEPVLERGKDIAVIVPVLHRSDIHLYHGHPHLHQSPGQQQRLAGLVPAISIPHRLGFTIHLECLGELAGGENRECQFLFTGHPPSGRRTGQSIPLLVQVPQKRVAVGDPRHVQTGVERQVIDLEIFLIRIVGDLPGIILGTQQTRVLPWPGQRPLHQERRQVHATWDAVVAWTQVGKRRRIGRPVVTRGNLVEKPTRLQFTRQYVMGGHQVVVVTVSKRTDDRVLVGHCGQPGKVFTDMQARHTGAGGLEFSPHLGRRIGLHVECLMMAGRPGQKDDHHRAGPRPCRCRDRLLPKHRRQAQTDRARVAHLEQLTSIHPAPAGCGLLIHSHRYPQGFARKRPRHNCPCCLFYLNRSFPSWPISPVRQNSQRLNCSSINRTGRLAGSISSDFSNAFFASPRWPLWYRYLPKRSQSPVRRRMLVTSFINSAIC